MLKHELPTTYLHLKEVVLKNRLKTQRKHEIEKNIVGLGLGGQPPTSYSAYLRAMTIERR